MQFLSAARPHKVLGGVAEGERCRAAPAVLLNPASK